MSGRFCDNSKFYFLDLWKENFKPVSTAFARHGLGSGTKSPKHFPTENVPEEFMIYTNIYVFDYTFRKTVRSFYENSKFSFLDLWKENFKPV